MSITITTFPYTLNTYKCELHCIYIILFSSFATQTSLHQSFLLSRNTSSPPRISYDLDDVSLLRFSLIPSIHPSMVLYAIRLGYLLH